MKLPESRVPDPLAAPALRWGILGPGWIAERFVAALRKHTRQQVRAVGSRSPSSARAFAEQHDLPQAHGTYEDLVADPEIDVVYIATPHPFHRPHARLALEAGKHILVEKPIGLSAAEAREIADLATARGLFCAEAMWTLYLPKFDVIRQVLTDGLLGEIVTVLADHGEWFPPTHRIMRADLAGGPLLDLGTYPVAAAVFTLGPPAAVTAAGTTAPAGVNGQASALLTCDSGAQALINTTILSNTPTALTVAGTAGTLTVPGVFFRPGPFELVTADRSTRLTFGEPDSGYDGLAYEAAEVARRITAGETGTPCRPMAEAITTLEVIDEIRLQLGIVF